MSVELKIDTKSFNRLIKKAPHIGFEESKKGLQSFMYGFEKTMKNKMATGKGSIKSRSGILAASMSTSVKGRSLKRLRILTSIGKGTASKYVDIQEHGGTIRAKGKKLTIPLSDAKTAGGKLKAKYRTKTNLRLTFRKVNGRLKGFLIDGPKDAPRFIFVLKDSVTLKPKLNFVNTFEEQWAKKGRNTINRIAKNIAKRANKVK